MNTCNPTLTGAIVISLAEGCGVQPTGQPASEEERVFEARLHWFLTLSAAA